MFNFSANHLLLLSRTECRRCVVFVMKDDSTRRVYRLYDFTKSRIIMPGQYYCVSGKVNSADKLYLVIHLAITLCRAMHVPARYATGYLGDIRIPPIPGPMDFSAWFEV